jgi:hypothetical protein
VLQNGVVASAARVHACCRSRFLRSALLGRLCQPAIGPANFGDRLGHSCGERSAEFAAVIGRQRCEDFLQFSQKVVFLGDRHTRRVPGEDRRAVGRLAGGRGVCFEDFRNEAGVQQHFGQRVQGRPKGPCRQSRQRILETAFTPIRGQRKLESARKCRKRRRVRRPVTQKVDRWPPLLLFGGKGDL